MSMTYTKLFSSITESTVWCEPDRTRLVWITMLAMADRMGRVWASIPGLANRARVPVEDTRIAITTFLSPDPDSRSPEEEGRRIREIDGGWQLINHAKYREQRDDEERRRQTREAVARHRGRVSQGKPNVSRSKPQKAQADADADAEAELKKKVHISASKRSKPKASLPEGFTVSDAVKAWAEEHKHYHLDRRLAHFTDTALAKGYQYVDWDAAFRKAIREDWAKLGTDPPPPPDPYADNPMGMYADWPSPPAEDFCIHGWGLTPELRVKHGDRADHECGQCQADAKKAAESEVTV